MTKPIGTPVLTTAARKTAEERQRRAFSVRASSALAIERAKNGGRLAGPTLYLEAPKFTGVVVAKSACTRQSWSRDDQLLYIELTAHRDDDRDETATIILKKPRPDGDEHPFKSGDTFRHRLAANIIPSAACQVRSLDDFCAVAISDDDDIEKPASSYFKIHSLAHAKGEAIAAIDVEFQEGTANVLGRIVVEPPEMHDSDRYDDTKNSETDFLTGLQTRRRQINMRQAGLAMDIITKLVAAHGIVTGAASATFDQVAGARLAFIDANLTQGVLPSSQQLILASGYFTGEKAFPASMKMPPPDACMSIPPGACLDELRPMLTAHAQALGLSDINVDVNNDVYLELIPKTADPKSAQATPKTPPR